MPWQNLVRTFMGDAEALTFRKRVSIYPDTTSPIRFTLEPCASDFNALKRFLPFILGLKSGKVGIDYGLRNFLESIPLSAFESKYGLWQWPETRCSRPSDAPSGRQGDGIFSGTRRMCARLGSAAHPS